MKRLLKACLSICAIASLAAWAAPGALAVNYSYPAIYTGTLETGGPVEFETSADGSSITRFSFSALQTVNCGVVEDAMSEAVPIVDEAFSYGSAEFRLTGSFPAPGSASGALIYKSMTTHCGSEPVRWTASTPTSPRDTTAPQTTIKAGPSGKAGSHKATFKFKANEAGSTFECKLDRKPWKGCRSPKAHKSLKHGKHVFKVRARDAAGNVDPSPAKRS